MQRFGGSAVLAAALVLAAAPAARAVDESSITSLQLKAPERASKPEVRWWLSQGAHTDQTIKESVK
jgi:hypothetical protein